MKIYRATRDRDATMIWVEEEERKEALRHVVLHSPTGFEWGYGGSGPADTALSILADYFGERPTSSALAFGRLADDPMPRCLEYYQQFKWDFIAPAPREGFEISTEQINSWLEKKKEKKQ